MSHVDFYKGLDADSKFKMEISLSDLAKEVNALNYGTHRFLSALVHELRFRQAKWNRERDEKYPARAPHTERSELADGIEALLNKGCYK